MHLKTNQRLLNMTQETRIALAMASAVAAKFIAKVDSGNAKSVETYKEMKALQVVVNIALANSTSLGLHPKTIKDAPKVLNTNDAAMWVTGWNEAYEALHHWNNSAP